MASRRLLSVWVVLVAAAVAAAAVQDQGPYAERPPLLSPNTPCRMNLNNYTLSTCGLPLFLANFQGYYACNKSVKIGRPASVEQLQAIVAAFPRVRGAGVGHSWRADLFCPGTDADSISVLTTEMDSVLQFMASPVDPKTFANASIPANFPIQVNEDAATVTVAGGITTRALMQYLANYNHWKEPRGWAIPAYPFFIDQTIAGAGATGTHGSTLRWGSLSTQMREMKVVLANGTLMEASPEANPHLWRALGVSAGRLGVIVEVTLTIVPNAPVTRTGRKMAFDEFVEDVWAAQEGYRAALAAGNADAARAALSPLDETITFLVAPTGNAFRVDFQHGDRGPEIVNAFDAVAPAADATTAPAPANSLHGVFNQTLSDPVAASALMLDPAYVPLVAASSEEGLIEYISNATQGRAFAYPTELPEHYTTFAEMPYNQMEVAVPLDAAGTCLRALSAALYNDSAPLWQGFRTPLFVRFVSEEDFYISTTAGGPRMFLNLEDYVELGAGAANAEFDAVVSLLMGDTCAGRLHWSKHGWTRHGACFDGVRSFGAAWCDFGCAAAQLDPDAKFAGLSPVWRWNATREGGAVADYASCCTPEGFNGAQCTCATSPLPGC